MTGRCMEAFAAASGLGVWQLAQFLPDWETGPCDCGCELGWAIHKPKPGVRADRPVKAICNTVGVPTARKAHTHDQQQDQHR